MEREAAVEFPQPSAWARRTYGHGGFWNDRLLDSYLDAAAEQAPGRAAVVDGDVRLTYADLRNRVRRIAAGLRRLGIGPGDVVSMQLPNWWEAMAVHFAVVGIGAVSNPLLPILREREMAYALEKAGTRVLVSAAELRGFDHGALALRLADRIPSLGSVVVVRGRRVGALGFDELTSTAEGGEPDPDRSADDPVVLLYTSGTEANPKGAVHSHNTLGWENRSMIDRYALGSADVVWAPSPVAHVTGVLYAFHLCTMLGAAVVLQDRWDAGEALRLIERERCSFVVAATPFLHGITYSPELQNVDVGSLRTFVCGGADVAPDLIRDAEQRLGVRAVRCYGSTEIPTITSTSPTAPADRRATTDGEVMPGDDVRMVADLGTDLPPGQPGRLLARGPEAMLGYLGVDPQPFDEDGWFDTGDIGRMDEERYVQIVGRSKDIIVRGGENLSAKEIEDLLYGHPGIADVAVIAVPDPRLAERACAVVVPRPGHHVDLPSITAYLETLSVARQKFPEHLEVVDELPRTPTGKVRKYRLRQGLADRSSDGPGKPETVG